MRFREKNLGVISDKKKAFLQISINPEDRDFLRFFWWSDYEKKKMKMYRHRRLVFGLNCSPFILGAVINNLLHNCPQKYRDVAEILEKSFYVDNCVTSVDTVRELSHFVTGATELMQLGNFELRSWESTTSDAELEPSQVLGLLWDRNEDALFCDSDQFNSSCESFTRRNVLAPIQKVFDPIGFTCPVTIIPKLLLQETWKKKLSWDERLPEEAEKKFIKWLSDLTKLKTIRIPLCVIPLGYRQSFSLHTFCDASGSSYACVIYLRSEG
ncbi:uncharacterized protein [Parasteatoda tepidariorum]|uniref:uncharacterized protein n=1 Tax=Parasteatoda tepidariorum TaxID=114398 RepID=UPI0039BCFF07